MSKGVVEDLQEKAESLEADVDSHTDRLDELEYLVAWLFKGRTVAFSSDDYGRGTRRTGEVTNYGTNNRGGFLVVKVGEEEVNVPFGQIIVD